MTVHPFPARRPSRTAGAMVMALHCSGSVGGQWRALGARLGSAVSFVTPDMIGTRSIGHWRGSRPFTLADEAAPLLTTIDRHDGPVHLVGHSYGGGVALHVAAMRRKRIASLTVYEPSAFHLLKELGATGLQALAEIMGVAGQVQQGLDSHDPEAGAECFIDYWNGAGAWRSMKPALREEIIRYLPKAPLDFDALIEERIASAIYAAFRFPVMIVRGGTSPRPARLVADYLSRRIANTVKIELSEAGHMAPITHADQVAEQFARHIENARLFAVPTVSDCSLGVRR